MSIIIRVKETGEVFDVSNGFVLEINNTSPLFNDMGTKSVSTTLPRTKTNIRLFGYANRLDITNEPASKMPVIVSDGSYTREGVLYFHSAHNTTYTYAITVAFAEGIMYNEMQSIKLSLLSNLPIVKKSSEDMISYMHELHRVDDVTHPLTIFDIGLKFEKFRQHDVETPFAQSINRHNGTGELDLPTHVEMVVDDDLASVEVPRGYGISPFVRVWYILDRIFDYFGYAINVNPFVSDPQLKRLCVLNNVIDAIVKNRIEYAQLMPDVTVMEFLRSLHCRFGLKIFVDANTKSVNLILLKDIFRNPDITPLELSSEYDIDYTEPKQLRLKAQKSLDRSETEFDNYAEFLAKYNFTIGQYNDFATKQDRSGILYSTLSGLYYQVSLFKDDEKLISSYHFDWDQAHEGIEYEDLDSVDECISMLTSEYRPYYGVSPYLRNSRLSINDKTMELKEENKLAFVFDMGLAYDMVNNERHYWKFKYGSIFPYEYIYSGTGREIGHHVDDDGNEFVYAMTFVGDDGCFNRFHKQYDAFLRHSNHMVKAEMNKPLFELSTINYFGKYGVENQPILIDKLDHVLGLPRNVTFEARTVRLYEPYDLDKSQSTPPVKPIHFQWVLKERRDDAIRLAVYFKEIELKEQNASNPIYRFAYLTFRVIEEDPNPPQDTDYWYLPPADYGEDNTNDQFHDLKISCNYSYFLDTVQYYERVYIDTKYRSWLEPQYVE